MALATMQARRGATRGSWRCHRRGRASLGLRTLQPAVDLEALSRRGWLVVKLPAEVIRLCGRVRKCILSFFAGSIAQKDAYRTRQEGQKVLSHPGYLTPSPGWAELFEVRTSCVDYSYRFPPGCEEPLRALFGALRAEALRLLSLISAHLCADAAALPALVAADSGPSVMRTIHYDQVLDLASYTATHAASAAHGLDRTCFTRPSGAHSRPSHTHLLAYAPTRLISDYSLTLS